MDGGSDASRFCRGVCMSLRHRLFRGTIDHAGAFYSAQRSAPFMAVCTELGANRLLYLPLS